MPASQTGLGFIPGAIRPTVFSHRISIYEHGSQAHCDSYPWILWSIWKARNAKVYENLDENPQEILRLADADALAWKQAHVEEECTDPTLSRSMHCPRPRVNPLPESYIGHRCFVDGSWKETDNFAGMGWYCTGQDGTTTMGAANLRRSLSALHSEVESLVWAMRCMIGADNSHVAFLTDCSDLVKMVSSPNEWPAFSAYLEEIVIDREEFSSFSLSLIPRNVNVKADCLARQVRTTPHLVTYVNNIPSRWF